MGDPSLESTMAVPPNTHHMSPEEFRRHGHAVVDWIANYMSQVASYPVLSQAAPGDLRAKLPGQAPQEGESFEDMLEDVDRLILPGITHWQSPNFFAYFPANVTGASILGELLSAGLGVQGMLWATSPACTELETHMLDWLVTMLGLPEGFRSSGAGGGVIQDSASSATLCAILCARDRAASYRTAKHGVEDKLVVYSSAHAHSSIIKGMRIAGLGSEQLRAVPCDENFAMQAEALEELIATDRAAGKIPCAVVATVGSTSSNAIDPVNAIGRICKAQGLWLHVDAAMSGTAAVCPEFRFINEGLERADSYCFNPHKWMGVNFDCCASWVADRSALLKTLGIMPEYLRNEATETGAVIDYRDWQVPLGRRFRALKLWFVIRHYGVRGLQSMVRQHVALAETFRQWVEADPDYELAAPVPLNLVCFRHRGGEARNQQIMDHCNSSGKLYLTHTRLSGALTLRLAIGQLHTDLSHVESAWQHIRHASKLKLTDSA